MRKRFSSLHLVDMAAWLVAIATFGCLAIAGLMSGMPGKVDACAAMPSKANLTPGA